jgi:hypothetical protein
MGRAAEPYGRGLSRDPIPVISGGTARAAGTDVREYGIGHTFGTPEEAR